MNAPAAISAPLAALFRGRFAETATWAPQTDDAPDALPHHVSIKVVFEATFANHEALEVKYPQSHTFAHTLEEPVAGIQIGDQLKELRGCDWYVIGIEPTGQGDVFLILSLDAP